MDHVFCRRFSETALMNKPMTHSDGSLLYLSEVVQAAPRLWSALDRENGSPTYGSFYREHWGWKFRDFPITMLQIAHYPLAQLWRLATASNPYYGNPTPVDDGYLGMGVGSRLLERAHTVALERHRHIWLLVDERNRAAIRLYERLGYRIIGRDGAQYRMLWEL
jgi:GNAT superfamily N-acetyltransferase